MLNQAHCIRIRNATENNLQGISLDIPHNKFIVVTGVSGSGKSSLVFDVIANEGQRRYLETFASFSRLFMGKMQRPQVDSIEGLMPVISIGQHTSGAGIRSTLGTMSDLYDMLRLLYARIGKTTRDIELKRSLFSFNSPIGSCPQCKGIGLEEQIDIDKLITDPSKSLREGVLAPTLPNGYIMYSQVTIDVLNTVCNAHDFDVDTAWNQLSAEQQDVILNGSTRIKIPFGKHSLESRLKWTGITAKPREEGYYKGMIPIMTEILHRDRNENILKYVKSISCSNCNGTRLNDDARSVKIHSKNISALSNMELRELKNWLKQIVWQKDEENIALPIVQKMIQQISMFEQLGMGHLSLNRSSKTLTGGESQRIRLINQISAELSNVLYVFDEPSINMHPRNMQQLNSIFHTLVQQGNTVIVVEHDPSTIFQADWIIDIGPGAGKSGGKLLFNGPLKDFLNNKTIANSSPTQLALRNIHIQSESKKALKNYENITLNNCQVHNLKNIDVSFKKGAFNVVCGVAGSGKSSLVHGILEPAVAQYIDNKKNKKIHHTNHKGFDTIDKLIVINQSPIGRTPRSNPATYTKLSDKIRDIFAKQESAQTAGFTKSHFSFNNHGGRCETCMGAGRIQIGMHFLGNVDIVCSICNGKRFTKEVLEITYNGKNISEIYELTANQAIEFFADQKAIEKQLQTLIDVGLGYITLGQSSTTLSGGEAQRIKLASQLQKPSSGNMLYILNEPSVGLHIHDVAVLLKVFKKLINRGDTIICIENDISIISQADYVIELGPDSGENAGQQIFSGTPSELIINKQTPTALAMQEPELPERTVFKPLFNDNIKLNGVDTHMLKHIDVSIPKNKLTVITGLSGTGKSSLAFDTLFAEARSRFSESMSTYVRTLLKQNNPAKLESCSGLCPTVAISRKHLGHSERSTVGTITGIYDHYRLLYSRLAQLQGFDYSAQHYSFNHQSGACTACDGIGKIRTTDPDKLISHPNLSIVNNAMKGTRLGKYYGDPYGRYVAIIQKIADEKGFDISVPWQDLNSETKDIILFGTGDTVWKLNWEFKNKTRSGEQQLQTIWEGFCNIIDDEYKRKHQNKNIDSITELMHDIPCSTCNGSRLKQHLLKVKCKNKNIAELSALSVKESISFFKNTISTTQQNLEQTIIKEIASPLIFILETLQELGLEYLSMHREATGLSGGEAQRVRIAGILSAQLSGVYYILDEPTIGLHPKNTQSLIEVLRELITRENTVVIVEHDETCIRNADHIIEMGPEAGKNGGNIVATGSLNNILGNTNSITQQFLKENNLPQAIQRNCKQNSFGIKNAFANNLKQIDVNFISNGIIAITGVSGSGKSSLINEVLLHSAIANKPINCSNIFGLSQFNKIIVANQQAIGNNSLSTPATFTGILDDIRNIFANTVEAKQAGLKKSAFSYHHKDGKCPECNGYGQIRTSMDFMSDIWTTCETCKGNRYNEKVLQIRFKKHTIADILNLTIKEAQTFFSSYPKLSAKLGLCVKTGIGHLQLGQAGNTLSGGESQRLKLASEMIKASSNNNLYLLDEPSTGLHYYDIKHLSILFNELADAGNTIIYIEHNPYLIHLANQVVELGPGSGDEGGTILTKKF